MQTVHACLLLFRLLWLDSLADHCCADDPCTANPVIERMDGDLTSCAMTNSSASRDYVCQSGYSASSQAECYASEWNTTGATCDENPCTNLTSTGLNHTASLCDDTPSGSTCPYVCHQGYTSTALLATCHLGIWSDVDCLGTSFA